MKRAAWTIGLWAAIALQVAGCMGNMELNELYIVHSVSLDVGDRGGVKVSAEIAKLGTEGMQPKGMQNKTFLISGEGNSLFEAARLIRVKSDRTLLWGQTTAIVISKAIVKEGIEKQIEEIRRFRQFRNTTLMFMIDGKASDVLEIEMPNASITAQALRGLADGGESTALTLKTTLLDVYKDRINHYQDIRFPAVRVLKGKSEGSKPMLQTVGFYAFSGARLAGFMSAKPTKGYLRASDRLVGAVERIVCEGESGKTVTFENTKSRSTTSARLEADGTPSVRIEVDADLNLVSSACEDEMTITPALISEWERRLNAEIVSEIEDFAEFTRERKTDLLGVGEILHRQHPGQWKQVKKTWSEVYPSCRFYINVRTRIDHTNFTV